MKRALVISSALLIVFAAAMAGSHVERSLRRQHQHMNDTVKAVVLLDNHVSHALRHFEATRMQHKFAIDKLHDEIKTCRVRTESLRATLSSLIGSHPWDDRVRLPSPPPGWPEWPAVGEIWQPDDSAVRTEKGNDDQLSR